MSRSRIQISLIYIVVQVVWAHPMWLGHISRSNEPYLNALTICEVKLFVFVLDTRQLDFQFQTLFCLQISSN